MSTIGKTIQENGVAESMRCDYDFMEFMNLDDDERLDRTLLDACIMAENANKQTEKQLQSTTDVKGGDKHEGSAINQKDWIVDENNDEPVEGKLSIKMEISCSQERLIEPNMDYTLDDVVEIYSISDEDDNESEKDVVCLEANKSITSQTNELNDEDDNEDLLTVFNDHNYMSQEITTPAPDVNNDLRQNIIDHIVKKRSLEANNSASGICVDEDSCNSSNESTVDYNSQKEIEDFVDKILEGNIKNFVKKEIKSEAIHTEDFVQNVINAVADEDAAEYAAEETLANRKQKATPEKVSQTEVQKCTPNISNEGQSHSAEGYHADDQSHDGTETCSFQSCSEHDGETKETENSISKEQQSNSVLHMEVSDNENCQRSANTSTTDTISDSINNENDDRSQLGSNATLPEYCSEPLEVIPLDERFEMAIEEEIEIPFGEDVEQNEASFLDNLLEQFENDAQHVEIPDVLPQLKLNIPVDDGPAENNREGIENYKSDAEITPLGVPEEEIDKNPQSPKGVEDLGSSLTHDISTDKTVLDTNKNLVEDEDQQHDTELESSLGANFERLDKAMEEAETLCRKSSILQEFTALVKEMHDDCEKFSVAATNIDSRLGAYITDKFEIMRELVRRCNCSFPVTERACQTEPTLSRRRLRKLNKKDKKALLASTDSSSCVGSSSSDGHISSSSDEMEKPSTSIRLHISLPTSKKSIESEETKNEVAEKKLVEPDLGEIAFSQLSQVSTVISEGVYDDGVVLSKYLLSDVFSAPIVKMGDDKNSDSSTPTRKQNSLSTPTSDDDTPISKENPSHGTEKTKQKANKKEAADENDKEIERLINLDGLMKRHNNAGTSKQVDIDKQKTKSQNQKNKTDGVLEFLENDLAKESLSSDESAKENEEEVITEKQYLERYNQDLKKQLLSDSSNDTSQDEEADDEFAPALSDESESGNRSPLVDKFLKTYNIDDSEEEDVEMASEEIPAKDTSATISINDGAKIPDDGQTALKKEENQEKVVAKTSDNSDCELLNDNFIHRKRTQPKSLEKILSEAEKRKKLQKLDEDLISLSSESDCSDVEAVEMEPAEIAKSRAIKPMLRPDQLQRETVKAQKSEVERIRRLEKKQALLARVLTENKDLNTDEELVLDYNEETKTFIKVHSELVKHLKPHQRDGVRFMYDSCYGGVDSAKKNNGSGCILAHCMGLGKTLQLIALMHTVISYKELKTHKILVLCPKSTVMNWGDEIARWLYPLRTRNLKVYAFNDTSDINEKLSIMRDWSQSTYQKAGCLLIGYEAFRTLVFYHTYKNRNNLDTTRLEKIRNLIDEYLLQPGADLVVCDEGHIIKNSKSAISLAVAEIKTQKRIVLTGTPIQNNLKEYYSMVNFIKPLFLGTEKEFANLYANPIKNGQHKDSNKRDIKVMKQRSFVLHKKLSKFVQRKEAELLKSFLPKKFEYVLFIPMTNVQNKLYERILEAITGREDNRGRGLITDYTCLRKIWTHPKVLEDAWKNAIHQKFKRDARKQANSDDDQPDDIYDSQTGIMSVQNDWWRNLIDAKDLESILPSNKLRTMFEILRMCEENGDKCLIFSAFVAVLNVVEYFFKKLAEGNNETVNELNISQGLRSTWESNKDYFRLDGKTPKSTRHEMIKRFNHPNNTRARVFLISAKAGGQGINLIGANRVIILDTSWNPSNDQQNIFRIFRLGQKKNCYIYRLLALGTMEEKVYSRSVTKQAMSFRVMDVQQIDRHYSMAELAELYTLTIPNYAERPTPIFPQDTILANLLRSFPDLVYKYHEHDSLLENKIEQELSEQEKIDAWNAYENDLQMNSQMANMEDMQNKMAQGNMQNYMGASGSIPGLNLQALLNFRNMNAQTNSPYINPSLLQQYKYNMANQQYLDMVNNYRQYSTPEGAAAFNASVAAAYSSINSSMYPGGTPSVSPHLSTSANLSSNAATHPLSALNDLSMFGLGINSGTSAATAAAVAVGTSLAQLPSTPTNSSSLYATSGMPTQPVSAAGLYSNPTASFYQTLQQLGYVGAPTAAANMLNNPALNSFTNNSGSFQAPRQTPPQSASRKSSTPDLTGYRNSGGGVNMPTAPPTTSTMSLSTTPMVSMATMPNELPKLSNINNNVNSNSNSNSNINVNSKSSNDLMNSNSRRTDGVSNRVNMKPKSSSSNSSISNPNKNTTTRTETNNTVSQNRQMITPSSVSSVTSKSKTSTTTSKYLPSMTPSKQPTSNITPTTTTKTADPQIRVKDMGQLCANLNRGSSLPTAAAAVARESSANNANNSTVGRNKQSGIENKITTPTSASATELLKARSEMQIIPTTSPPGTASISKQLSEISPSISLTAVRNNNVKSSSTNSGNFPKTSGVNTSTVNSSKSSRVNSPATITSSMFTNRQQNAALNVQSKKNITNMNAVGLSHSNLTVNTKKAVISNFATAKKSSTAVLPTKKTSAPTPQSSLTMTTATNSLNTTSNIGTKATITGHGKNSSNNNVQYISESAPRANLATNAPTRITPSSSIKNTPSILRSHHIRKMPPPLPTTSGSTSNVISNTSMNASTNSNQSSSIVTKPMPTPSNNTKTSVPATVANTAQLLYNNKINTTARRSFSPTTTLTQRTSRTASPANTSTVFMEKVVSNNSNKINTTIVPTSTTSAGTIAFPVHLKRSNSALGTMRPLSALTTLKTSVKGLGNRTKSSTSIVTPRIASVASLNVSTVSTPTTSVMSSLTPAAAAMRVAALKRLTTNNSKVNLQTTKQLQSSSAMKIAAATSVVHQKRPSPSGTLGSTTTMQSQQQPPKQRISVQSNGSHVNVSVAPTRTIQGDTRIGGLNVRPILKGVTMSSNSTGALQTVDKGNAGGSQVSSASGQAVEKLLLERKRKISDTTYKEGGSLSKRPKDS